MPSASTPRLRGQAAARLRAAGYDLGDGFPEDGDELIHALIAAGGHDTEWLTEEQLARAGQGPARRLPALLFATCLTGCAIPSCPTGESRPASCTPTSGHIVLATLRFGNVLLMIQPPRGFGENPVAIYHDPELPPSHHYLAAYRWLDTEFRADAIVHLGKHGTLEWLPGKGLGLSGECAPDAVLGDVPLVYPFIVNDPGEGTQAKRRGHAVIVDHLVPPMARADTYGEMAKLEQLLDEYATVAALDPDKLPALRAQIWSLIQAAHLHHDLGVERAAQAGRVRRLRAAHRRLPVRGQGRRDQGRAARARRGPGRRGAGQPGAGHPALGAGVGRPAGAPCPACAPRSGWPPTARSRGADADASEETRASPGRGDGRGRLGPGPRRRGVRASARPPDPAVARDVTACCEFAAAEVVPQARARPPARSTRCCTRWPAATSPPGRRARRPAAW